MPEVVIRVAEAEDVDSLTELSRQLGQAVLRDDAQRYLARAPEAGRRLLVALLEGQVVGWLEVEARSSLPAGTWAEVTGLVVEKTRQGRGVGSALVGEARRFARSLGLGMLRVRTRIERAQAARFYEKEGFRLEKQQRVYELEL